MKILHGVAVLALLAGPAFAQSEGPHVNLVPEIQHKTPEEKAQDAIRQKAYQESLRKIPDAQGPSDPWGGVRGAEATQPKAKRKTGQTN
ncbi:MULTISPECIES: hypothetical protein [Rhodopseudomonas]|uniref:DUF4148 domain-containing protein n=1 Tax=Rhodopseudomonas palustris (strain DX-1) TaxID=652103 RepID=E6VIA3_RHOPX|nr:MULTISPECIES: hypothetical protein [Rhodopseudomonas]NEW89392.1 hypothetical protein [Rhodopseudomonas sp. WA056]QDL98486.1 hypothetical protein FLL57_14755 [Rhodopseudomonas palustris]